MLEWENVHAAQEEYHTRGKCIQYFFFQTCQKMLNPDLSVSHQAPIEEAVSYTRRDNLLESEAYDKKKNSYLQK